MTITVDGTEYEGIDVEDIRAVAESDGAFAPYAQTLLDLTDEAPAATEDNDNYD